MVLKKDQVKALPKGHPFIEESGFVRYKKTVIINRNSGEYTRIGQQPYNRIQEKQQLTYNYQN